MLSKFLKNLILFLVIMVTTMVQCEVIDATTIVPIAPGDRIFYRGKQWVGNGTGGQLDDYEVIGLSASDPISLLRCVTDTLSKKLIIGLDPNQFIPAYGQWPIDALNDYEDSLTTGGGVVMAFKNELVEWTQMNIPVAAVMYNQEIPDSVYFDDSVKVNSSDPDGKYTPEEYAGRHTALIKKYKEILLQYSPDTELWVFSGGIGNGSDKFFRNGTHWDSLTTAPNAIDVCWFGVNINVL